ncbi:MAG TPA: T9SS type A sorting domain-containing protein, partial [Saprospiraceae bacterium]|nr:T9SS type A sorting domain-containing protein [Saprospiraceae bacterium]
DSAEVARYLESISRWQAILERNAMLKDSSEFVRNLSFDAGATYEYTETSDTTSNATIENSINSEFSLATGFGFSFSDVGFKGNIKFITNTSNSFNDGSSEAKGVQTGYTLADNDPGDAFTVDVSMDSVYKTPVFKLKAGQSSCPWEPGSANREGPNLELAPGSQFVASNVPANEPAVFQFKLGNLSASNEDWTYAFTSVAANNPHGAVIKLNGQPLNYLQKFIIPYGTSQMVTLTVERGPIEYDYDSLLVALVSECEFERNLALSLPLAGDPKFFSGIHIGAHFIRPCSEVNINVPEQDWVIFPDPMTPGSDDERRITVSGYDTTEASFKLIRVQYRRSNGDGAWINIPGISDRYNPNWIDFDALPEPKPPVLQPDFTQFFWETTGLSDGPYEIRAVTVCSGDATDRPGYSQVIKGRIDREPPSLVGVPQPSDGVYQVGDEISFTFNQPVNCSKLIQADLQNPNNVGLYDATTNTLIDANITCVDNKIVIDPIFQNEFYENHILRAELHSIEDLTGNVLIETDWEFYVDRNELAWLTDSIGLTKYADENKTITAKIHNRGGYPVPFTIQNIPDYVHVTPDAGTLVPNEIRDIQFTVDSTVARGWYSDSIILHTETGENPFFMGGDEIMPFGARVICRPPGWHVNPALYQLTMNMNLRFMIDGEFSVDPEDQVGVFIAGQLRGTAKLEFVPAYNYWVAFVTVYGNTTDAGKPLVYEIFNAAECLHYPASLSGNYTFVSNSVVGIPAAPGIVTTGSLLLREIDVKTGWNWISFNLGFPNPAINTVLGNIPNPDNDLIKDQTKFSTFGSGTWSGALNNITNTTLYLYQAAQPNTIKITGNALTPSAVPIPIVAGWNWIGYIPNFPLTVNDALASIPKQAGDIIKSQSAFAQYVNSTIGWVGSLTHLKPLNGYMLKTASAGTIVYPNSGFTEDPIVSRGAPPLPQRWSVDAAQYEHNMTLIGMFQYDNTNATMADMELGAFVGEEIRGAAQAVYIENLDSYMFFLTSYSNSNGEQLHFKLYDPATGEILDMEEKMTFLPNLHQGSIAEPVPFTLQSTSTVGGMNKQLFDVSPNPFRHETVCRFTLSNDQDVSISIIDLNGTEVYFAQWHALEGFNTLTWNGLSYESVQLSSGVYIVRLKTDEGLLTRKVVLQR